MPLPDLGLLDCFYFFLLMLGVFYAILVMIAGGLHAIHLPGVDLDLHGLHLPGHLDGGTISGDIHSGDFAGHEVHLLSLSPISIAAFVTSFGGIGIIALHAFNASPAASLLWAVAGSVVMAVVSHLLFFYLFIAPQASSALRASDIIGETAEVTVPIPAGSVGEIAYVAMGERHTATARAREKQDIPRGTLVNIEGLAGTVMIVKPK